MDPHSLQNPFSPPQNHNLNINASSQNNMFYPSHQHQSQQHRSAIDADALAAGVHRFISNPSLPHSLPSHQLQQRPLPHPHSYPRPFPPHPHSLMHPHSHRQASYISLPPGVDPSTVDFRTFYPYDPQVVKHRKRTTRAQLKVLEDTFKKETKPNGALRKKLAAELEMTPRGVQVWFQNRRAKEKTLAKKACVNGQKTINLQSQGKGEGSSSGTNEGSAEADEDGDEPIGEEDDVELDGDGDGINSGAASTINGINHSGDFHSDGGSSAVPQTTSHPLNAHQSDASRTNTESHGLGGYASASQCSSLSKSNSPESTPPEMTPPNGLLDINVSVEGSASRSDRDIEILTYGTESSLEDAKQQQQQQLAHSQGFWGSGDACIPRAASRTPTLGFDAQADTNVSADGREDMPMTSLPPQESLSRRPSLPTHLGPNTYARAPTNMASRAVAGGTTGAGPHRISSTQYAVNGHGGYARQGGSLAGFDPNARRMSLERLAVHPYAYAAMQQNSSVYGPGAILNMTGMGPQTGMGHARFRPTLPATTHSTPTGTPQAHMHDLPAPQASSVAHLPTLPGTGSSVATEDASMNVIPVGQQIEQPSDISSTSLEFQPPLQGQGTHYDEMGRMVGQMGSHNVVISPRTYAPPTAGPLPAPDYSFGSVGRETNDEQKHTNETQSTNESVGTSMEEPIHQRNSTESNCSSTANGFSFQQASDVKLESQDTSMGNTGFDILDPTSHSLSHGHPSSDMHFTSLSDSSLNLSAAGQGNMYYRDGTNGIVPLGNYSTRFNSIVSVAESESSVTSGACFSSEAGSLMQPELHRPSNAYMETRRPSYTGQVVDMFSNLDVHNGSSASLPHSIESHSHSFLASRHQNQNRDSLQHPLQAQSSSGASNRNMPASNNNDINYGMADERSPGSQSQRSSMSSPDSSYSNNYGGLSFAPSAPSLGHSAASSRSSLSLSLSIPPSLSPLSHSHSTSSHPYHPRPQRQQATTRHQNRSHLRLDQTDKLDFLRADFDDVSGTGHYSPISAPQRDFFASASASSATGNGNGRGNGRQSGGLGDMEFAHAPSSSSLNLGLGVGVGVGVGVGCDQGQEIEMGMMGAQTHTQTQTQSPFYGHNAYSGSRFSVNSNEGTHYSGGFY